MMTVSDIIIGFISAVLSVYTTYMFMASFAPLKYSKKSLLFLIPITIAFASSMMFVENKLVNVVILFGLTIGISLLFNLKWQNYLLLTVSVIALLSATEYIVGILISALFSVSTSTGRYGIYYIIGVVLSKFLTLIIIAGIRIKKHQLLYTAYKKQLGLILSIPITTIALIVLQYNYFIQIPESNPLVLALAFICYAALVVSNVIIFDIIDNICTVVAQEAKINTANELINQQAAQYQQLIEHNKEILQIKHDFKHFLLGLSAELEEGNPEAALDSVHQEYARMFGTAITQTSESGSSVIDVIVQGKMQMAGLNDITIIPTYFLTQPIGISQVDFAIILGNALDNAIEATEKVEVPEQRVIQFNITTKNNSIFLSIKNPVCHDVDTNNLRTTKTNSGMHGYGILSMKNIAKKYQGEVVFSCEKCVFQTNVILMNESSQNHHE